MRHRHPLAATVLAALASAACGPPEDALVSRCTTAALSVVTTCELTARVLRQERSAYLDGGPANDHVRVKARFAVKTGQVTVALPCENGRLTVTPERPALIECDAAIDRGNQKLHVGTTPGPAGAEGLLGTLELRPL